MITVQDIDKLATLARVKIDDSEKNQLVKEIDSILTYIDQIKKATVSSSAEERIGSVRNAARPDIARTISPEDRERLLNEAPDRVRDFVAVKKIL